MANGSKQEYQPSGLDISMASSTVAKPVGHRYTADSLGASVLFLLALTGVQRGIGLVRKFLFCDWLAPEELGQWDLVFGFLTLAAPLAVIGMPGALLRYVEYYRQRGQLRAYLARTALITLVLAIAVTAILVPFRTIWADIFFGGKQFQILVLPVAVALLLTILFNAITTYFTAMRLQRFRSLLTAAYAVLFTIGGSCLLLFWRASAVGVIMAHAASLFLCCCVGGYWIWNSWHFLPAQATDSRLDGFISQVLPFAAAVWVTNVVANLFPFVDRYIIVASSGQESGEAFQLLGQYHVARLMPVFMLSLAQVLQATLLPYLSKDWETGDRERVAHRLNSFVRLFGLSFFATATVFLLVGPALFTSLLGDKYQTGLSVLNVTLTHGVVASLFVVASSYIWCDSKGWLVNVGLLIALVATAGLNLMLLPRFGLLGAATASCIAVVILLVYSVVCCWLLGMRFSVPTTVVMCLPLALLAGPLISLLTLAGVAMLVSCTDILLTTQDKERAGEFMSRLGDRLARKQDVVS